MKEVLGGVRIDPNQILNEKDQSWDERVEATETAWKTVFENLLDVVFSCRAFSPVKCCNCQRALGCLSIRCNTCTVVYCGKCDLLKHEFNPFHSRLLESKNASTQLLSQEFVDSNGKVFVKSIMAIKILKCPV